MTCRVALSTSLLLAITSCTCGAPPAPPGEGEGEGEGEGDRNACVSVAEGPGFQISAKADLRWKRAVALRNDLERALDLDDNTVCSEVGLPGACFSLIHLVPLGGNDPVKSGMYKPIASPGVTTSLSTDRVILSACGIRADAESVDAVPRTVWRSIDFAAASLSPDDPGLRDDVTELYRRLLARDPTSEELDIVASLAQDDVSPRDFAKTACYAIASTTEFLFN